MVIIVQGVSLAWHPSKYYKAHKLHKYILTSSSSCLSRVFADFIITNMDLPMNIWATCLSLSKKERKKKKREEQKASNIHIFICRLKVMTSMPGESYCIHLWWSL